MCGLAVERAERVARHPGAGEQRLRPPAGAQRLGRGSRRARRDVGLDNPASAPGSAPSRGGAPRPPFPAIGSTPRARPSGSTPSVRGRGVGPPRAAGTLSLWMTYETRGAEGCDVGSEILPWVSAQPEGVADPTSPVTADASTTGENRTLSDRPTQRRIGARGGPLPTLSV